MNKYIKVIYIGYLSGINAPQLIKFRSSNILWYRIKSGKIFSSLPYMAVELNNYMKNNKIKIL